MLPSQRTCDPISATQYSLSGLQALASCCSKARKALYWFCLGNLSFGTHLRYVTSSKILDYSTPPSPTSLWCVLTTQAYTFPAKVYWPVNLLVTPTKLDISWGKRLSSLWYFQLPGWSQACKSFSYLLNKYLHISPHPLPVSWFKDLLLVTRTIIIPLTKGFSNFKVPMNYMGILLKCSISV